MIRLMIVEDDVLYRKKMLSLLDWESIGFTISGIAVNGKEALDQFEEAAPGVILTDISMPQMDGIELIRQVKARNPAIRFVVLSSYDDFHLVKGAMRLGVDDYILKSELDSKMDEFLHILREIQKLLQDTNAPQPLLEDKHILADIYLSRLIAKPSPDVAKSENRLRRLMVFFPFDKYMLTLVRRRDTGTYAMQDMRHAVTAFLANEQHPGTSSYHLFFPNDEEGLLLVNLKGVFSVSRRQALANAGVAAFGKALAGVGCRAGSSSTQAGIAALPEAYAQAVKALADTGCYGLPDHVFYHPLDREALPDWSEMLLEKLSIAIATRAANGLVENEQAWVKALNTHMPTVGQTNGLVQEILLRLVPLGGELGVVPARENVARMVQMATTPEALLHPLFRGAAQELSVVGDQMNTDNRAVRTMMAYMRKHFAQDITLADLAAEVGLSEHYASNLFKQETGKRVLSYLNSVRIAEAKRLLRCDRLKVYQVAEQCGFPNVSYFSKVFRKKTGLPITAFRSMADKTGED